MACVNNCKAQGRACICPRERTDRPQWPKPNPPKDPKGPRR